MTAGSVRDALRARPGHVVRRLFLAGWPWLLLAISIVYIVSSTWIQDPGALTAAGAALSVTAGSLATATVLITLDVEGRPAARHARRLFATALLLWTLAEGHRAMVWALAGAARVSRRWGICFGWPATWRCWPPPSHTPPSAGGRYGRLREFLDTAILAIAGTALSWLIVIRPVSMALPTNEVLLGWAAFSSTFDLILVLMALRLLVGAASTGEARGFLALAGTFLILQVSDLVHGYLTLGGEIGVPTMVAGGWGIAASLIGLVVVRRADPGGRHLPNPRLPGPCASGWNRSCRSR